MSSLDELILFSSGAWREKGMLNGTRYAFMEKVAEYLCLKAGANFPAGYYEPEVMPFMIAFRDACVLHGPLFGARGRTFKFNIRQVVVPRAEPLASVHVRLPNHKQYTELAYLFEYEKRKRLVLLISPRTLVYVQFIVECFRRAEVLPQDFALGWQHLARDNKSGRLLFTPDTAAVLISRSRPDRLVQLGGVADVDVLGDEIQMPDTDEPLRYSFRRGDDGECYLRIDANDWTVPATAGCRSMWDLL